MCLLLRFLPGLVLPGLGVAFLRPARGRPLGYHELAHAIEHDERADAGEEVGIPQGEHHREAESEEGCPDAVPPHILIGLPLFGQRFRGNGLPRLHRLLGELDALVAALDEIPHDEHHDDEGGEKEQAHHQHGDEGHEGGSDAKAALEQVAQDVAGEALVVIVVGMVGEHGIVEGRVNAGGVGEEVDGLRGVLHGRGRGGMVGGVAGGSGTCRKGQGAERQRGGTQGECEEEGHEWLFHIFRFLIDF